MVKKRWHGDTQTIFRVLFSGRLGPKLNAAVVLCRQELQLRIIELTDETMLNNYLEEHAEAKAYEV